MNAIHRLTRDGIPPDVVRPDPARVTKGDPVHTIWSVEDRDGLYCGLWQSTPGAWRVSYDEWEYVHILQGHSVLTANDGTPVTLRAGDTYIIRPGYTGVWEVFETTLKEYVIRT
jgi:uncharacterized protein